MKPLEVTCPVCKASPLLHCENFVKRTTTSGGLEGRREAMPELHRERKRLAAMETLRQNQQKVEDAVAPPRTFKKMAAIKPGGTYTPPKKKVF